MEVEERKNIEVVYRTFSCNHCELEKRVLRGRSVESVMKDFVLVSNSTVRLFFFPFLFRKEHLNYNKRSRKKNWKENSNVRRS